MKTTLVLKASDINELKLLGSYLEVKNHIENELGLKLGVRGWNSIFYKINALKKLIVSNKSNILAVCDENSFVKSKSIISKMIGIKVKAKSWSDLRSKIENMIILFCNNVFDPHEYYEKTKLNKFKNSSKLEGIDIDVSNESCSLESILAKYKR
ncbi:hypothetical protein MNBD_BACTEROID06-1244 [hydrothermal vent metagenome]|uniref:Uncharacterized protein n=1 Tax=hydrothermal vent metagenome TaxID=652676 RepID=A0A3B0V680_9ZZZZ